PLTPSSVVASVAAARAAPLQLDGRSPPLGASTSGNDGGCCDSIASSRAAIAANASPQSHAWFGASGSGVAAGGVTIGIGNRPLMSGQVPSGQIAPPLLLGVESGGDVPPSTRRPSTRSKNRPNGRPVLA